MFSLIQYGLLASIGVTRSSSSRPFLCTADYDASSSKLGSSNCSFREVRALVARFKKKVP